MFFPKTLFLLFFFLASLSSANEQELVQKITDECHLKVLTPSLENRKTSKIRLKNGLQMLLISDPNATESASALVVKAGYWQDPKAYPGMAHFLEHMLFQGTSTYPNHAEYMHFLLDHGGTPNAFTSTDHTAYIFSIPHDFFVEALDRFSHFFIDPLFDSSALAKELHAVDQEFGRDMGHDGWRALQVFQQLGNPLHPNAAFSIGNSQTLSKIPSDEMKQWYQNHYSANQMFLVLYSPIPLEDLEKLAIEKFTKIPNRKLQTSSVTEPLFSQNQKGHLTYIVPLKNLQILSLQWEIPESFLSDDAHSASFLAFLLNQKHPHSLTETLKDEHLIESLEAGVERIGASQCLFNIELTLTDLGAQNTSKILQLCFETLFSLNEKPLPEFLFNEFKTLAKLSYEYQSREESYSFVKQNVIGLLHESLETYPEKTLIPTAFNQEKFQALLKLFSPHLCNYTLIAPPQKSPFSANQKEVWMGCEFSNRSLSPELLSSFEQEKKWKDLASLPPPNPFLPEELSLVPPSNKGTLKKPLKIIDEENGSFFYAYDTDYKTPEISWIFQIKSPLLDGSPKSSVLMELYLKSLDNSLSFVAARAQQARLYQEISPLPFGFLCEIQGFSEKAPILFKEVLEHIDHLSTTQEQFDLYAKSLKMSYENQGKDFPAVQATELISHLLVLENPTYKEKLGALAKISYEDFLQFQKSLLKNTYIEGMLGGNMTIQEGESLFLDFQKILKNKPFPPSSHYKKKVFIFSPHSVPMQVTEKIPCQGNAVFLALGEGEFSFPLRAAQDVLSQSLVEPFFTALRSEQKTAYHAKSFSREIERQLFQFFFVQSNSHEGKDLLYRFEFFIENFLQNIETLLPKDRFSQIKSSLIAKLKTPAEDLSTKVEELFTLAFSFDEDFSRKEKQIEALEKLSYEQFLAFTRTVLSHENKKRLVVILDGKIPEKKSISYKPFSQEKFFQAAHYESILKNTHTAKNEDKIPSQN